jgi:hypothetical protein
MIQDLENAFMNLKAVFVVSAWDSTYDCVGRLYIMLLHDGAEALVTYDPEIDEEWF